MKELAGSQAGLLYQKSRLCHDFTFHPTLFSGLPDFAGLESAILLDSFLGLSESDRWLKLCLTLFCWVALLP